MPPRNRGVSLGELDNRVTALETALKEGLDDVKGFIRDLVKELKTEHLKDIKQDHERLSNRVTDLERWHDQKTGGSKTLGTVWHFFSVTLGGLIALVASWLSSKHPI